jgi:Na+-transporting methylmalonyl-CoA/oxaloacetate decarboxylase gamma subunit
MNDMLIALQITALGMGLVFGAILVLWGMMNLLTSLTAEKATSSAEQASAPDSAGAAAAMESEAKARAAAVAVAIALAEGQAQLVLALPDPPTTVVSAWQLGMRTRQMYQKGISIRRRAR